MVLPRGVRSLPPVETNDTQGFAGDGVSTGNGNGALHPLRIVLVYDDVTIGIQAKGVADGVARQLPGSPEVQTVIWSFDGLVFSSLRHLAVVDAVSADCVIVATSTDRPLPVALTAWADSWLHAVARMPGMLVALVGSETARPAEADTAPSYLGRLAASGGMNFVHHSGEWRDTAAQSILGFLRSRARSQGADAAPNSDNPQAITCL